MICCYDLFMAWFCCYDFDMVSVMILIWFQLWFLMWVKLVIWSQPIGTISKIFQNRIKTISKSYQNRIKIIPKPYQNRIKTVSKSYQKRIKIVSKSYQNHKNLRQIDQKPVPGLFLFLFLKPTHWNHTKIISKSYQNRIKTISKSYQNHKNHWKIDQKHVPGLFLFLFLKPTRWNHIKTVSKSYQNRIKIVSKPNQNHIEIITPNSKHIKFISSNRIQNHIKIVKKIFPEFSILEGFRSANFMPLGWFWMIPNIGITGGNTQYVSPSSVYQTQPINVHKPWFSRGWSHIFGPYKGGVECILMLGGWDLYTTTIRGWFWSIIYRNIWDDLRFRLHHILWDVYVLPLRCPCLFAWRWTKKMHRDWPAKIWLNTSFFTSDVVTEMDRNGDWSLQNSSKSHEVWSDHARSRFS